MGGSEKLRVFPFSRHALPVQDGNERGLSPSSLGIQENDSPDALGLEVSSGLSPGILGLRESSLPDALSPQREQQTLTWCFCPPRKELA